MTTVGRRAVTSCGPSARQVLILSILFILSRPPYGRNVSDRTS
jgi:hypothetical protein